MMADDAETLVRLLLDPPHDSCLPRGALSGGNEDGASPPDVSYCELSVALCTDAHIKGLNKEWRDKDAATDVLSFPADSFGDVAVLGDCVISIDTARTQANELGHGILDECRVLLVHGLLHLCGYDHELGETQAAEMGRYEDELLRLLVETNGGGDGPIAGGRRARSGGAARGAIENGSIGVVATHLRACVDDSVQSARGADSDGKAAAGTQPCQPKARVISRLIQHRGSTRTTGLSGCRTDVHRSV